MISPAVNAPIIGIYQDSLLGSYRFSRPNINFTPREAMNLLMMYPNVDVNALRKDVITNFDVLSQIMPHVTLKYKNKLFKDGEDEETSNNIFELRNGQYIRGQIEKTVLASSTKGIIHRAFNDYGNMAAANFIDNLQNVVTEYMKSSSFSVGVSDLIANRETQVKIGHAIMAQKLEVQTVIDKVHLGIFENDTSNTNMSEFETRLNNILNKATEQSGKIGHGSLGKDNRFLKIVNSGSKGSLINISQMISCLGQQNVDGKRIPYGFESRTLPHYSKFDDSPEARGFIENSYISGLTAPELFFHAMGGRIGLIDTAVKTSQTGYIQRRLIKGLEDLKAEYDGTIRNNRRKIVQFAYGDDGFDSTRAENQGIKLVEMTVEDVYMHYDIPGINDERNDLLAIYTKPTLTRLNKQLKETADKCKRYIDMMLEHRDTIVERVFLYKNDSSVKVPVAFQHIIANIQGQLEFNHHSSVDITPLEAFQLIEEYYAKLQQLHYEKPTELFKVLYFFYLSPKELLIKKRFHRKSIEYLLETILLRYKQAIVHPGEMVGVIAGQSIGEPTTQLTLNSVTYETPIVVRNKCGELKKIHIGDFITENIKQSQKVDYMEDKDTTYAELGEKYYEVPCATEDGNTVWRRIEAVTQHPVVNEDGTNTMLRIVTEGNREVIATKAKSFLKLINGKIIEAEGDTLKVGDYLPVSMKQIDFSETNQLNLKTVLSPAEYIYTSEIEKAKAVMDQHHWWLKNSGKTFVLPYKRSDSFVAKISDQVRNGCKTKTTLTPDCVYTKQTNICNYKIPELLDLDYNFGYLVGAYAAEGCMTKTQISIANNDIKYFKPILELCKKMNITTKIYKNDNKCKQGWTSQDLRIYNTVLCRILEKCCGKLSHNKFISDKIIFSNKECILGFLDAYIGGDGTINKKDKSIVMSSVSKVLLIDVQQMLNIIGVYSFITKPSKITSNNRNTPSQNIQQLYTLFVRNSQAKKLASMLNMTLRYKQDNLQIILNNNPKYEINRNATFIPNEIDGYIVMQKRDNDYQDILFDKIIKIEEIQNTTNYAYDLTVDDTKNFNIYNGLALRDTFHFAGVASKSNVTRGVPRIEEILSLSSDIKQPTLTVYLKPEDERQKEKAQTIMYMLEHTRLEEVVKAIEVCFDPDDLNTMISEDKDTIEQFRAFENMVSECSEVSLKSDDNEKSKWIIRMEMDPEVMLEKNITMDDINFTLKTCFDEQINCIYSDFNADKLIFRIRMNEVIKSGSNRGGVKKTSVNPLDQSDQIYILKNLQDQILKNVVLRGIKGINKVILRKVIDNMVENNGIYKKQDIWVLDTIGTNLLDVLGLDFIDNKRTMSNDIVEIYNVLGIEAARQAIYNELVEVVEFDGTYINFHNYSVLVDRMTFTHKLISIFRHGINNDNIGPIAKASFEETPEMFLKAARHAELDTLRGVSANVMCGQEGFFGTGAFQVILDIEEAQKLDAVSEYKPVNIDDEIDNFFGNIENPDDPCGINKISIQNNVGTIEAEDMGKDNSYNPGF